MRSVFLTVAGLVVMACSGEERLTSNVQGRENGFPVNPNPAASVSITPSPVSVRSGKTVQLSALVRDGGGTVLSDRAISWSSSNTSTAQVSSNGLVTGGAIGSATIQAKVESVVASAAVTVTLEPVASVAITPLPNALAIGSTATLVITVRDASGAALSNRSIVWSSSNQSVATVSSAGVVSALSAGSTNITATSEGVTGSVAVTVASAAPPPPPPPAAVAAVSVSLNSPSLSIGQTTQGTATTRDASNNLLTGRTITWSSSNTAIATVSGSGLVSAVTAGSAQIRASSEGVTGAATVTVTAVPPPPPPPPAPVAVVTVTGSTTTLVEGSTTTLTATTRDAANTVLTGRVVTWSSSNPAVATVSSSGVVTGVAAGTVTIRATSETIVGTYAMTITAAPPPPPPPPPSDLSACSAATLMATSFETGTFAPFAPDAGNETIVGTEGYRGTHAVRGVFQSGGGDVVQGITGYFGNTPQNIVYARWAYKQDATFYNGGIKKLLRFRDPSSSALMGTLTIHWGRFAWSWDGDSQTWWVDTVTPDQLRGGWHWFEVMNDLSTAGTVKAKVWIDGQLVVDAVRSGVSYGVPMGLAVIGGVFNAPAGNGNDYIDDAALSNKCIPAP